MSRRGYSAAILNRLTSDWVTSSKSANEEIRYSLRILRARSRELAMNNDYARKFLKMCVVNVVGPSGIALQNKARDINGNLDKIANDKIEEAFSDWGKKENADVTGRLSWLDMQRLFIETVARDGEILIRKIKGANLNKYAFSLQLIEADHLDENHNKTLENGNRIITGVEVNAQGKPLAYHLFTRHPGDNSYGYDGKLYERVPSDEICHAFITERPGQVRGVPWMHTAMTRLNMLGAYEEAELVAARVSAAKMGFFTSPSGDEYVGDDKDSSGNVISEATPGSFEQLPQGVNFQSFDPQHPSNAFPFFMKTMLRGIASGLGVSYNSMASDLEGVNYSSIRAGTIEERDLWRIIQTWMTENFCNNIFSDWLLMTLGKGAISLPPSKYEKFNAPVWNVRGWQWIDPLKDIKANIDAVTFGLKTRTQIASEQGYDLEDIYEQLQEEQKLASQYGLDFILPNTQYAEGIDNAKN
ncbi:MAG: phage portal protein [Nitrospirae bacterium]|nr:phage portal protein [Nitrospirota bacterium]